MPATAEPNIENRVIMCNIVAAMSYFENGVPAVLKDVIKGWELLSGKEKNNAEEG